MHRRLQQIMKAAATRSRALAALLCFGAALGLSVLGRPAQAATNVTITGPGGQATQSLPDAGGSFDLNMPLVRNAVNTLTVAATDKNGQKASKQVKITQLSLDSVVVSKVTATPLTVQQITQLVNDGVIKLDDPSNFNVSQFDIVLTIGHQPFPISIPIAIPIAEEFGQEDVPPMPDPGNGSNNSSSPDAPEVVVFQVTPPGVPGAPPPPAIPGVIVIEGRIKTLKEFFDVRLLLLNMSGIFTLHDVVANISFPDGGLSNTLPADGIVSFGDILPGDGDQPGQAEREFIIRGDEIGTRRVKVGFGGTVIGPGIDDASAIPFSGAALTSVEVKGPPSFLVQVSHPDSVTANVPYDLKIDITNTGQTPALYASLDLDVGGAAQLLDTYVNPATGQVQDRVATGTVTRPLGNILPGESITQKYRINPLDTGPITSCMGISDQNITLQVSVGDIGCLTGHFPPGRISGDNHPTVAVLPDPNQFGVGTDSPVVAVFSNPMNAGTITLGEGGSFQVIDDAGEIVPGVLNVLSLNGHSVAVFQVQDGITNRLKPDTKYKVFLSKTIADAAGYTLANDWTSQFTTTNPNNDLDPPQITLTVLPPVDPNHVLSGQLVRVDAYAADQGTGVASVELRSKDLNTTGALYQLIDQKTVFTSDSGPAIFTIDSSKLIPGHAYQLLATARDKAGNAQDATLSLIVASSSAAPTVKLPVPAAGQVLQGISVDLTPTQTTGGIKSISYYLDGSAIPLATQTLAPYQTTLGTADLALGLHTVRAVAVDGLGQTGEDSIAFSVLFNANAPVVSLIGVNAGQNFVSGTKFAVSGAATDPVGVQSVNVYLDNASGSPIAVGGASVLIDTSLLSPGAHKIVVVATNLLGVSNDPNAAGSSVDFTVLTAPTGNPPAAPNLSNVTTPAGGKVTLTGTSVAGARVDVTNVNKGLTVSVTAGADGSFSATIDADTGDVLSAVAFDFTQSLQPSPAAQIPVLAPPVLDHIELSPPSLNFSAANAFQDIVVTGFYNGGATANLTSQATFSSNASGIASVNAAGRVVAHASGVATITVNAGGKQATAQATVSIVALTSIAVKPASLAFTFLGQSATLQVVGNFSNGTTATLTSGLVFTTGNSQTASVNFAGVVTAVAAGSTSITVAKAGVAPVSIGVDVNIAVNLPPTAKIVSPAPNAQFQRGANVSINVQYHSANGGVKSVAVEASGAAGYSETKQISPAALDGIQNFNFAVPQSAAIGGVMTLVAHATDVNNIDSAPDVVLIDVVDHTAPTVSIAAPATGTPYNYTDLIKVHVVAADAVGVTNLRYVASGAFSASGAAPVSPASSTAETTFTIAIPFSAVDPDLVITAYAGDAAGNEGQSIPISVLLTGADITPPQTNATSASAPGSSASATVSYQVTDGLSDLDHVELYFRRNAIGTFNLYTGADGLGDGRYFPQSGANGTIVFDSTRMGGDGHYEFYTIGVDKAGNREPVQLNAQSKPVADQQTDFASGAAVVTINTSQQIVASNFDNQNLKITGAGVVVTIVGAHAFHNVEVLNGATLKHLKTTTSQEFNLNMIAWSLSIDATSLIDLNALGYLGGTNASPAGRTQGNTTGSAAGAGGSYGGLGANYDVNNLPNPTYGSLVDPQLPGSGGGSWSGVSGGDGGGLLLLQAINVAVDGQIRANGASIGGSAEGDGSGGGINIKTATLSGAGSIAANGGGNGVGAAGGGGRIAIQYLDLATMNLAGITAAGNNGQFGGQSANGTVFLKQAGQANGELVIEGQGAGAPFTQLQIPAGFTFDSITLRNGAKVTTDDSLVLTNKLLVTGGSTLTHGNQNEAGLHIVAKTVQVDAGSAIDVVGRGYLGTPTGADASGKTLGGQTGSPIGAGGSHGGLGAAFSGPSSIVYDDPKNPTGLGGGGGSWSGHPGLSGGGRVTIDASSAVIVSGAIRADGASAGGSAEGDGAGGSVRINTSKISGAGTISANGGGDGVGVGGGGGRIAIYADFVDPSANLNNLLNVTAFGGVGQHQSTPSSAGTFYLHTAGQTQGDLYIDAGKSGQTAPYKTPLSPIGFGAAQAVAANSIKLDGTIPQLIQGCVGLRINPDIAQAESFVVASNTTDTLTVVSPNEHGIAFAAVAGAGKTYAGDFHFDNIFFRRGGYLETDDLLRVDGDLNLADHALLAQRATTVAYTTRMDLTVGRLLIDATSAVDATAAGYIGTLGGADAQGHTVGNALGSATGAGGGYGGLGAHYSSGLSNPIYGNIADPRDLGSGGGSWGGVPGSAGGGLVLIRASQIVNDGAIRANGGTRGGSANGDGSGGSINIATVDLSGAGIIAADGGGAGQGVGGGGGRILVNYSGTLSLPDANVTATGGGGQYGDIAGNGTVLFKGPGQAVGGLVIDGQNLNLPSDATTIPGGVTFDTLTLRNKARVTAASGVNVSGALRLLTGSVLTHDAANLAGLAIHADSIEIDATSSIDATGRGYSGAPGGADAQGKTLNNAPGSLVGNGGGYGGLGSSYPSNGGSNPAYGSLTDPQDLGSGGGNYNGQPGGAGGGLIKITVNTLSLAGSIRADGQSVSGSANGGGSGGTVNIVAGSLTGDGTVTANGGGNGIGVGGGGGRVAIRTTGLMTVPEANLFAVGGSGQYGDYRAGDGTIFLKGVADTLGRLVLDAHGGNPSSDRTSLPSGYAFDSMVLRNNARLLADAGLTVTGNLLATGNSSATHTAGNFFGLQIQAGSVQVDAGSSIDGTGRGYLGTPSGADAPGTTLGGLPGSPVGTGGSYGGLGAGYQGRISGLPYGDPKHPVLLGSGGGSYNGVPGSRGGGRIEIHAAGTVTINGAVNASGGIRGGSADGDGSGGSILIQANQIAGSGAIAADGGGSGVGVAGGGGRVALVAAAINPADFGNLRAISAFAGRGQFDDIRASAGTVYLRTGAQTQGDLYIDDNSPSATSPRSTVLPALGFGVTQTATATTLRGDGNVAVLPQGLAGLRVNPDVTQQETFAIAANTTDTLTVVTPNEHGAALASVAAQNHVYALTYHFDNVVFRRGGNLELADQLQVDGDMNLAEFASLTHRPTSLTYLGMLHLTVGHILSLDSNSKINANGRGYLGGPNNVQGRTLNNALGSTSGAGGGYGGQGGVFQSAVSNAVYGSLTDPIDAGSGGGGGFGNSGGAGGGVILINAGAIANAGLITAQGAQSTGSAAGDGSGGSIDLVVGDLSGAGAVQANGGGFGGGTGGGGGRIAVHYSGQLTLPQANLAALGGQGQFGTRGGDGTVFLQQLASPGTLIIGNPNVVAPLSLGGDAVASAALASELPEPTRIPGGILFGNVLIGGARVEADGGIEAQGSVSLSGGALLTHRPENEGGLAINAGSLSVDAASSIDVSGAGYPGGSEWNESGRTVGFNYGAAAGAGGSHGGAGGQYGRGASNPIYDSQSAPALLGSGGGAWGGVPGGAGGGLVAIDIKSLFLQGAIRADGAPAEGDRAGGGSGGSIRINAASVSGTGTLSANGGGDGIGVGGGGGRIALHAAGAGAGAAPLAGTLRIEAGRGQGNQEDGANGTISRP